MTVRETVEKTLESMKSALDEISECEYLKMMDATRTLFLMSFSGIIRVASSGSIVMLKYVIRKLVPSRNLHKLS